MDYLYKLVVLYVYTHYHIIIGVVEDVVVHVDVLELLELLVNVGGGPIVKIVINKRLKDMKIYFCKKLFDPEILVTYKGVNKCKCCVELRFLELINLFM